MNNIPLKLLTLKKIDSLTGLRFVAAYVVVLSHIFGAKLFALNEMGGVSVQLFFVLSGFVMYLNYADKIKIQHISFKKFMLFRIYRLYPVYFLSITLYLILMLALNYDSFGHLKKFYLVNILMLQSWFGSMAVAFSPINAPSWSVSDEMFFYLSFFILVYFLPSRKIFLGFIGYVMIWIVVILMLKNQPAISFKWLWYINPLYRVCDFFVGYFIGRLYLHSHKPLSNVWLRIALELVGLVGLIMLFGSQYIIPLDVYWWSTLITSIVAALVIYVYSINKGILAKLLSSKVMILLGESSYSLYLIHFLVLRLIIPPFIVPLLGSSSLGKLSVVAIELTLPVVVAIIIYKLFELPLYKFLKQKV